jgi:hypothetical protein
VSHVSGEFSVISDESTLEVVSRQGGPAGVLGVSTDSGVDIEVDGADVSQLTAVRVWHDGTISPSQLLVLEQLFGDLAPSIVQAFSATRAVRIGTSRSRLNSLRDDAVSQELSSFVLASDALQRPETPSAVRPLLVLDALVAQALGGLPHNAALKLDLAALELAVTGVPSQGRRHLRELLFQASRLGIIDTELASALAKLSAQPEFSDLAVSFSSSQFDELALLSSLSTDVSALNITTHSAAPRPQISVDPSGVFASSTSVRWAEHCNLSVSVERPYDPTAQWWARARRDSDGCIVAAGPLVESSRGLHARLLVSESDHLVIDVVAGIADRVLAPNIGALARAYEAGRKAARLERLGRMSDAAESWNECSRLHGVAGDFQRQKMAVAREFERRSFARDTLADHIL